MSGGSRDRGGRASNCARRSRPTGSGPPRSRAKGDRRRIVAGSRVRFEVDRPARVGKAAVSRPSGSVPRGRARRFAPVRPETRPGGRSRESRRSRRGSPASGPGENGHASRIAIRRGAWNPAQGRTTAIAMAKVNGQRVKAAVPHAEREDKIGKSATRRHRSSGSPRSHPGVRRTCHWKSARAQPAGRCATRAGRPPRRASARRRGRRTCPPQPGLDSQARGPRSRR